MINFNVLNEIHSTEEQNKLSFLFETFFQKDVLYNQIEQAFQIEQGFLMNYITMDI